MSKFKVGDRVKVVRGGYDGKFSNGCELIVGRVSTSRGFMCYPEGNDPTIDHDPDKGTVYFDESDLELIKPEPKQALKNYEKQFTGSVDQSTDVVKDSTVTPNEQGGIKFDQNKIDYTYLLKDLPVSVEEVTKVLIYGAKKYNRSNYSKVESERYEAACLRHVMSYLQGEKIDPETGYHHLAHAVCCLMFLIEREVV